MTDKPKPPPVDAPKEQHQRYAKIVLEDPEYMQKPADYKDLNDEVIDEGE